MNKILFWHKLDLHFKSALANVQYTHIKYSGWKPIKGSQTNLMDPHKVKRSGIVYKVYI